MILKEILKNLSILFVEDNMEVRESIEEVLKVMFKKVYIATNGLEGFDMYQKYSPDIILSDIDMPQMSGIEFIQEIRKNDNRTKIIIMSAYDSKEYLIEAVKLKLEDYLLKPFSYSKFVTTLKNSTLIDDVNFNITFSNGVIYKTKSESIIIDNNKETILTIQEAELMKILLENRGEFVKYEKIEESIWRDKEVNKSTLRTLVNRLKAKLGKDSISSKMGFGYRLDI
jgi:DNA-binding response OmpR family regulator